MTGDFTRDTFRPQKAYSSVRMQQGRLFTDADWNEQADIARAALRGTAKSVIGASGMPEDAPGFALIPAAAKKTLLLGGGLAYVDGIAVGLAAPQRLQLARHSGAGAATQWKLEAGLRVRVGDYLAVAGANPDQAVRVSAVLADDGGRQVFQCAAALSASNAVSVDQYVGAESQPFWPGSTLPAAAGDYLAYLDVWERDVSAADDPLLRETALGGPDTAQREQVVWQLRFAALADLIAAGVVAAPVSCNSFRPGWTPFGPGASGTMAARAVPTSAAVDPCALPAAGGYRSLENHLYRVEIHTSGANPTFKWSRDNAIHESRYGEIDNGELIVGSLGADEPTALRKDDWVEVLDEARLLKGQPGFFARIADTNGTRVSLGEVRHPDTLAAITNAGQPDLTVLPATGIVRRWEGGLPVAVQIGQWVPLENGVEVRFAAGRVATREYWTIPARSLSASIEWPLDEATGEGAQLPARGIAHHYCALGLVNRAGNGDWSVASDCRNLFPPLTALTSFLYLGGDGQEAMPDPLAPGTPVALGTALRVGVIRGKTPIKKATVRFEVVLGNGKLGAVADNLAIRTAETDDDGIARMDWALDPATPVQRVTARLLNSAGNPTHLPITFSAELRTAARVSYDPANTPTLAGANTVQEAIELLAGQQCTGCSTYVITEGSNWVAVLDALKPGEDAAICFQRGTYTTDKPVLVEGKGHLTLHGAGEGTKIIARRAEAALVFKQCASVTIRDLAVSAPDGSGALEGIASRQGVLTLVDCPVVSATNLAIRCGGGVKTERTGITVRGSTGKPLEQVEVARNRLTIGLAQDGVLVTDTALALIADNVIAVAPGKGGVTPGRQIEDARWRKRLIAMLVAEPSAAPREEGASRQLRVKGIVIGFDSPIPQAEWDALFKKHPPTAAEMRNADGLIAYITRLSDEILEDPEMSPTYARSLKTMAKRVDRNVFDATGSEVRRSLILTSDPVAIEKRSRGRGLTGDDGLDVRGEGRGDGAGDARAILIEIDQFAIQFESPVSQADWNSAMKLMPPKGLRNDADLIRHLQRVAWRMVSDEKFRERLGSVIRWLERFVQDLPSYGRQAITCGGAVLDDCTVRGNRVIGFVQGVHIGVSQEDDKPVKASAVAIADNHLSLLSPGSEVYVPMGLFCGNADTVRIQRNIIDWARGRAKLPHNHGIRVWGEIGRYLKIADNRVAVARIGIAVQPTEPIDRDLQGLHMWLIADNLIDNVTPANAIRAPKFVIRRDNRPD